MAETTWIVITEDDLNDYLVGAQMDALKSAALAEGQDNPFDRVMPDIAARIRAEVRACVRNRVSNLANSIPPDLKAYACYLIIEAMQTRLSGAGALPLTDDQKTQASEARKYLRRIATCEVPIAQPTDPETTDDVQRAGSITVTDLKESTTQKDRVTTRDKLRGL